MTRRKRLIFGSIGEAAGEYRLERFYLMRQIAHLAYAVVFTLLGSAGKPIEPSTRAPAFRDFYDRIWGGVSLVTQYASVHLNQIFRICGRYDLRTHFESSRFAMPGA